MAQGQVIAPPAAAEWQARAERGDARAAFQLGQLYTTAENVPRDDASAAWWYQVAAELGLPEPQFALGLRYATGQGASRDLRRAHMWINLAAVKSVPGSWEARDHLADLMTGDELAMAVRRPCVGPKEGPDPHISEPANSAADITSREPRKIMSIAT